VSGHARLRDPSEYAGEDLCPRCGVGAVTGWRYRICTDGVSHDMSCELYAYADLCSRCERELASEVGRSG
jgi:hypothetical protein